MPAATPLRLGRLRACVQNFSALLDRESAEDRILARGAEILNELVRQDDWLPPAFAAPDPRRYQQFLLHCDSAERFSIVSFVWAPGQSTPIHDHTVWGLVGMLRAQISQNYHIRDGKPVAAGAPRTLAPGDVETLSPTSGDIHQVRNALTDRSSVSIHVYGDNIGRVSRSIFTETGEIKPFISGYSNEILPNFWGQDS